jgi:hypothetical protein
MAGERALSTYIVNVGNGLHMVRPITAAGLQRQVDERKSSTSRVLCTLKL